MIRERTNAGIARARAEGKTIIGHDDTAFFWI
jgi:DNA invertase Pin-like site-specific DNA recombinase